MRTCPDLLSEFAATTLPVKTSWSLAAGYCTFCFEEKHRGSMALQVARSSTWQQTCRFLASTLNQGTGDMASYGMDQRTPLSSVHTCSHFNTAYSKLTMSWSI